MKAAAAAVKIAIEQQLAAPELEVQQNVLPATHHPLYLVDDAENLMAHNTDDTRIKSIKELAPPMHLVREFPCTDAASETTFRARDAIHRILHGGDDRLLVVIGPCSIHDADAALDYAKRLLPLKAELDADLKIVMRVYFEKPRTTVGWKGFINDPDLNESHDINKGLRAARKLLLEINEMGMPAGTEYLDLISPQYFADLISWGAIGARTTESQSHRQLASGLSCPVGFKNGTDGNVRIAVDAIKAASAPHHFLSVTKGGHSAIISTNGNEDCHVILRGGKTPNYDAANVDAACQELAKSGLAQRLMVDFSHANSSKQYQKQMDVSTDISNQLSAGEDRIVGVMVESHINPGRQDLNPGTPLDYGVSITDACIGFGDTETLLRQLAHAVRQRRVSKQGKLD
jgi:3-deoxy-7-phosphoheptulonate synthase